MSFTYIASPYTHADPGVRVERYLETEKFLHFCLANGDWAYSPIVHCHALGLHHQLPHTFEFWMEFNHTFMRAAHALYVLCLDGWRESKGVMDEISFAKELNQPTFYAVLTDFRYDLHGTPPMV